MKKSVLLALLVLAAAPAYAGTLPGPEMGEGFAGLSVLAAVVAGYVAVRHFRKKRVQ
jgi:hypothetical protein